MNETAPLKRNMAMLYIGDMQTAKGKIYLFYFLRHQPRRCDHPGCRNVLHKENVSGLCTHHFKHVGRAGNPPEITA